MSQTDNISWPDPIIGADCRKIIADIEMSLDLTPRLQLTDGFIESLLGRINSVHIWLRSSAASAKTEVYNAGREAVLAYIRDVEDLLAGAVEEYTKKGRSQKFFKFVRDGRKKLEDAKTAWTPTPDSEI